MRIASAVLLMFGLTLVASGAQNLGDMAREQRRARVDGPESERTITTETATASRPGASLSVAGVQAPAPVADQPGGISEQATADEPEPAADAAPAESAAETSDDSAAPSSEEEAWRARFAAARAEIQRAEDRLQLSELELSELQNQLLTRSDIYNREYQLAPAIAAKEQEIVETRQRVNQANQDLDDLRTELREAGLPAGWSR